MPLDADRYYMRHPTLVPVTCAKRSLFFARSSHWSVEDVDGASLSRVLEVLTTPALGRTVHDVKERHGGERIDWTLDDLVSRGELLEADTAEPLVEIRDNALVATPGYHFKPGPPSCDTLVVALTGTVIAGLMAPVLLSLGFCQFQRKLEVIVTESAEHFVQSELLEYYGIRTWGNAFERRGDVAVPHISLAKAASALVVVPATAASIARLAGGTCSDLVSLVAAAMTGPVIVAPTMNTAMWVNPAVRRNVDQLRNDGCYVIEPTYFFEAAELIRGGEPGCGMTGTFWGGPAALMAVVAGVIEDRAASPSPL